MLIHDNIVVGSGPIGCHIFQIIKKNSILITGKTNKEIDSKNIHPKIRLSLKKKTNKIADIIYSKKNNFFLYTSAEIGGLTNYWGGQFFNYKKNENWPKKIFGSYSNYIKNIKIIDKIYPVVESKTIKEIKFNEFKINQLLPPIIKNLMINKNLLKKENQKIIINDRVVSFEKIKKNLIKVYTENKVYYCKNLILSTGPIGNAFILLRSFKKINYIKFKDDNPRVILGLNIGKKKYLKNINDKILDFDIFKKNKLLAYTTIYNIDPDHFNSLFKPIIKIFRSFLKMIFFYGQYWVANEYNQIKLSKKNGKIILSGKTFKTKKNDTNIIKKLSNIGFKVIKIIKLKFAYGFHYHCLMVNYKNKLYSLNNFIKKLKLQNNIYCFDSSIIDKIGLKPPTKTYLATANYLVRKKLKIKKSIR